MAKIDLNLMAVLEAIYDAGNTSRAAETLHLSQPAVSHALARLRGIYNDPLFVRQGHSMVPTPATDRIIRSVKQGLLQLRQSVSDAQTFKPSEQRRVYCLSQRDAMETVIATPLMKHIETQAPHVKLHSIHSAPQIIETQLHQRQADVCIELLQHTPEHIHQVRLFTDSLVIVGRKGHPYFQQPGSESELARYPHVQVSTFQGDLDWTDHAIAQEIDKLDIALRCVSFTSALRVVLNSDKLSIMPRGYVEFQQQIMPISLADIPFKVPDFDVYMYWHERNDTDPGNLWLRQQIIAAFHNEGTREVDSEALKLLKYTF